MPGARRPRAGARRAVASGQRLLAVIIAALGALSGFVLLLSGSAGVVLAGSPTPTAAAGGDPRSSGQGPGLVGDPLTAIVLVAAIAVASAIVTLLYVRATSGTRGSPSSR